MKKNPDENNSKTARSQQNENRINELMGKRGVNSIKSKKCLLKEMETKEGIEATEGLTKGKKSKAAPREKKPKAKPEEKEMFNTDETNVFDDSKIDEYKTNDIRVREYTYEEMLRTFNVYDEKLVNEIKLIDKKEKHLTISYYELLKDIHENTGKKKYEHIFDKPYMSTRMKLKTQIIETGKEVRYIYHLGDIHIHKSSERKQEYLNVFKTLYNIIEKNDDPNKLIVLCGDIFHEKNEYDGNSPYVIRKLLENLSDLAPIIIIAGNHDCKKLSSNQYEDGLVNFIKPISKYSKNKIHYLQLSGIYYYNNIVFGVSSVLDNLIVKSKYIKSDKIKIALYHGALLGSRLQNNCIANDKDVYISKEIFKNYDYCLFGDIHVRQYLNGTNNTMAYSGSLICQNFGEDYKEKGFILWDLQEKKSEFVNVYNEIGYITVNIDGNVIEIPKDIPPKVYVRGFYKNTTRYSCVKLIEENIQSEILGLVTKKIDVPRDINNNNNESEKNTEPAIKDTDPLTNYEELIRTYCENNNIMAKYETLLDMYKKSIIVHNTDDTNSNYGKKWKPVLLKFSNIFKYGVNNVIDFRNLKGIVACLGKNAIGKSSIADILLFVLFNKIPYGDSNDIVHICDTDIDTSTGGKLLTEKDVYCEFIFEMMGEQSYYRLIKFARTMELTSKSLRFTVQFERYKKKNPEQSLGECVRDSKGWESLITEGTNRLTIYKHTISKYFGSYNNFIYSHVSLQKQHLSNFVNQSNSEKMRFLYDALNINIFDNIYRDVYKTTKQYKDILKITKGNITKIPDEVKKCADSNNNHDKKLMIAYTKRLKSKDFKKGTQDNKNYNLILTISESKKYLNSMEINNKRKINSLNMDKENCEAALKIVIEQKDNYLREIGSKNSKENYNKSKHDKYIEKLEILSNVKHNILNQIENKQTELDNLNININQTEDLLQKHKLFEQNKKTELIELENAILRLTESKKHNLCETSISESDIKKLTLEIRNIQKLIDKKNVDMSKIKKHNIEDENIIMERYQQYNMLSLDVQSSLSIIEMMKDDIRELSSIIGNTKTKCTNCITVNDKLKIIIQRKQKLLTDAENLQSTRNTNLDNLKKYVNQHKLLLENDKMDEKLDTLNNEKSELVNQMQLLDDKQKVLIGNRKQYDDDTLYNKQIEGEILLLTTKKNTIDNEIMESLDNVINITDRIKIVEDELNACCLEVEKNEKELINLTNKKKLMNQLKKDSEIEDKVTDCENRMKRISECVKDFDRQIKVLGDKNNDINKLLIECNKLNDEIIEQTDKLMIHEIYKKMVSNTGIPFDIIKNVLIILQENCNNFLSNIVNYTVHFSITASELSDEDMNMGSSIKTKDKHNINVYKSYRGLSKSIDRASGFENFVTNFAIKYSLAEYAGSSTTNFTIIDEGFGSSDSDNLENFKKVFDFIRTENNFMIVITHIEKIKLYCDSYLNIIKVSDDVSRIDNRNSKI